MEDKVISYMQSSSIRENNENFFQIAVQRKCMNLINKLILNISIYRHLQKCLYKGLCPKLSTNFNNK